MTCLPRLQAPTVASLRTAVGFARTCTNHERIPVSAIGCQVNAFTHSDVVSCWGVDDNGQDCTLTKSGT